MFSYRHITSNTSNTRMVQDTTNNTSFITMNRRNQSISTLILNSLLCYIALVSCVVLADISDQIMNPQNHRLNLTALIQDSRVWDPESLYRVEDIQTPKHRQKRSTVGKQPSQQPLVVDMCQAKMEVLTPYYGTNANGALRTIINSELIQQAIQVETCIRTPNHGPGKCNLQQDCGCEQKYKWYRLLSLDPKLPARGLFMDWFQYPSNCVCRCKLSKASSIPRPKLFSPSRPVN